MAIHHLISLQQSGLNQRVHHWCQHLGLSPLSLSPFIIQFQPWRHQFPGIETWLNQQQYLIFLSPNAVHAFAADWPQPWPKHPNLIAIGEGTRTALRQHTDQSVITPAVATSEGLLALACLQDIAGQRITLVKGHGGRTLLNEQLSAQHAKLTLLCCYERMAQRIDIAPLLKIWQNKQQALILATSSEALTEVMSQLTPPLLPWLLQQSVLVTSTRLKQQAQILGFSSIRIAAGIKDSDLFNAIKESL